MKSKVTANSLTQHVLRALDLKGFHVWRQNNGGVYDPTKKVFRANSSTPGISDVLGYSRYDGTIIGAEIKAGKDKLSPSQIHFLKSIKEAGGIALVIRDLQDVEAIYTTTDLKTLSYDN